MYAKTMSAQPAIAPLHIQSVVDHVYSALRERILSGDLPRGTKLRQASLADELGVSRTPLREALRRLSTEGLVEFSPNRGATVSELDFGDMRHAWSARVALEPGAARLAAQRRDPESIAVMRDAVKLQRQAAGDGMDSFAANRSFHLALAAASGNPHLTRFAEMLWVPRIGVPIYQAQVNERWRRSSHGRGEEPRSPPSPGALPPVARRQAPARPWPPTRGASRRSRARTPSRPGWGRTRPIPPSRAGAAPPAAAYVRRRVPRPARPAANASRGADLQQECALAGRHRRGRPHSRCAAGQRWLATPVRPWSLHTLRRLNRESKPAFRA